MKFMLPPYFRQICWNENVTTVFQGIKWTADIENILLLVEFRLNVKCSWGYIQNLKYMKKPVCMYMCESIYEWVSGKSTWL